MTALPVLSRAVSVSRFSTTGVASLLPRSRLFCSFSISSSRNFSSSVRRFQDDVSRTNPFTRSPAAPSSTSSSPTSPTKPSDFDSFPIKDLLENVPLDAELAPKSSTTPSSSSSAKSSSFYTSGNSADDFEASTLSNLFTGAPSSPPSSQSSSYRKPNSNAATTSSGYSSFYSSPSQSSSSASNSAQPDVSLDDIADNVTHLVPQSGALGGPGNASHLTVLRTKSTLGRSILVQRSTANVSSVSAVTSAIATLNRVCNNNAVALTQRMQRFHERPGLKRKRLKMVRWRKNFKARFANQVERLKYLKNKGW